jgi:hypothetical protein
LDLVIYIEKGYEKHAGELYAQEDFVKDDKEE